MQFWKKAMANVRKHGDVKLGTTEARKNYLVNEKITKYFWDNLLEIETTRTQMLMNKPFYLGLSVCMIFGIIIWSQNIKQNQNYVTWILIALQST